MFTALATSSFMNHVFIRVPVGIGTPLGACCAPVPESPTSNCGDYDAQGNPLYTVCEQPGDYFFWDGVHPTDAGWKALTNLFYSGLNFTDLSPNLLTWLNSLNLDSSASQLPGNLIKIQLWHASDP